MSSSCAKRTLASGDSRGAATDFCGWTCGSSCSDRRTGRIGCVTTAASDSPSAGMSSLLAGPVSPTVWFWGKDGRAPPSGTTRAALANGRPIVGPAGLGWAECRCRAPDGCGMASWTRSAVSGAAGSAAGPVAAWRSGMAAAWTIGESAARRANTSAKASAAEAAAAIGTVAKEERGCGAIWAVLIIWVRLLPISDDLSAGSVTRCLPLGRIVWKICFKWRVGCKVLFLPPWSRPSVRPGPPN